MRKINYEEFYAKFRKVCPIKTNIFNYFGKINQIELDGKFSSDELREIAKLMDECFHGTKQEQDVDRIKLLKIGEFTSKDIKVQCHLEWVSDNNCDIRYSFYVMKDGKDWDFYYGLDNQGAGDWWPKAENEDDLSPLHDFIPIGFREECENVYSSRMPMEKVIEVFNECGFTVEKLNE
jgi:hypothetical protein